MLLAICLVVLAGPFYVSGEGTVLSVFNGQNYSNPLFNFSLSSSYDISDFTSKVDVTNYPHIWIYIHGWEYALDANESKLITAMSQNKPEYLVISVDYDYYFYTTALTYVTPVGQTVGKFLSILNSTGYPLNRIQIVGHSLGAHIAGVAGEYLDGELEYIEGLDPAGVLITDLSDFKLKSGAAQYVQALHTTTSLGTALDCGDSDFWYNDVIVQPDCAVATYNNENSFSCSHLVAIVYYYNTIFNIASYTGYSADGSESAYVGTLVLDTTARGDYYVTTTATT